MRSHTHTSFGRLLKSLALTTLFMTAGLTAAHAQKGSGSCCPSMTPADCIAACMDDNDATRPACCPSDPAERRACIQRMAIKTYRQAQAKRNARMAHMQQTIARSGAPGSGATVSSIPFERQAPLPMGIVESDQGQGFEYDQTVMFTYTSAGAVRTARYRDTTMGPPVMDMWVDSMGYNAQGKLVYYQSYDPFLGAASFVYRVRVANNRPISATMLEDNGSGQLEPFQVDSLIYTGTAAMPSRLVRSFGGGGFALMSDSLRFAPGADIYDMLFNAFDGFIAEPYRGLIYERARISFGPISLTVGRRYVVTQTVGGNLSRRHVFEESRTPPQQGYYLPDGAEAQTYRYNPQGLLAGAVNQEYDSIPRRFTTIDSTVITYQLNGQGQYTQLNSLTTDPQGTFTERFRMSLSQVTSLSRRTPVTGKLTAYFEGGRLIGVGTVPAGQLRLTDAAGRVVNTQAHTGGTWTLPAYGLPAGVYTVEWVSHTSGERRRSRLVLGQ